MPIKITSFSQTSRSSFFTYYFQLKMHIYKRNRLITVEAEQCPKRSAMPKNIYI